MYDPVPWCRGLAFLTLDPYYELLQTYEACSVFEPVMECYGLAAELRLQNGIFVVAEFLINKTWQS